ncbi:MAG: ferredoxin family protein [Coprococcus sp.]
MTHRKGNTPGYRVHQNIPCNPCQDACPKGCISIGANITSLPTVTENPCIGCGMCVASCSGQAIFLVDEDTGDGYGTVTLPYEFLLFQRKELRAWHLDVMDMRCARRRS